MTTRPLVRDFFLRSLYLKRLTPSRETAPAGEHCLRLWQVPTDVLDGEAEWNKGVLRAAVPKAPAVAVFGAVLTLGLPERQGPDGGQRQGDIRVC